MIMGLCAKCEYCSQAYRIHFSLAGYFPQKASFICKKCGNDISVTLGKNGKFSVEGGTEISEDVNVIDVTISPDKPLDAYSSELAPMQTVNLAAKIGLEKMMKFGDYEDDLQKAKNEWENAKLFFRILKMNGVTEAEQVSKTTKNEFVKSLELISSSFLSGKWEIYFRPFDDLYKKHLTSGNLTALFQEIKADQVDWFEKVFNASESYFCNENEFEKIAILQKCDVKMPDKKIQCHWNKIKKVYADIYEAIGCMFMLPSAVNNLECSRLWNEFKKMKWEEYLEHDMNGRGNNFKDNPSIAPLLQGYDNRLRNAPSHGASRFDAINSIVHLNCGKNGKKMEQISLCEFIQKTNEIFAVFQNLSLKFMRDALL